METNVSQDINLNIDASEPRKDKTYKESVYEVRVPKIAGCFYFIGRDGYVYRRKFIQLNPEKAYCSECGRRNKKKAVNEKLELGHLYPQFGENWYPIKKEIGWMYYMNKEGSVWRFRWRGSARFFKKLFGTDPTPEQMLHLKQPRNKIDSDEGNNLDNSPAVKS